MLTILRRLGLLFFPLALSALSCAQSGSSTPAPDAGQQFSAWQSSQTTASTTAEIETKFNAWQLQRTSADSINFFKCTTSTDLDNPECVGNPPGAKMTGTKDVKTPITLPLLKEKTGDPDCPGLAGKSKTICSGVGGALVKPATVVLDNNGKPSPPK